MQTNAIVKLQKSPHIVLVIGAVLSVKYFGLISELLSSSTWHHECILYSCGARLYTHACFGIIYFCSPITAPVQNRGRHNMLPKSASHLSSYKCNKTVVSFYHVKGRGYNTQFLLYPRPLTWQRISVVLYVLIMGLTRCYNKKASIRWQDSARRQFQAGLRGDVGL